MYADHLDILSRLRNKNGDRILDLSCRTMAKAILVDTICWLLDPIPLFAKVLGAEKLLQERLSLSDCSLNSVCQSQASHSRNLVNIADSKLVLGSNCGKLRAPAAYVARGAFVTSLGVRSQREKLP